MQGLINCRIQIGLYNRPDGTEVERTECLINVYATMDIEKGTELLMDYGEDYFTDK